MKTLFRTLLLIVTVVSLNAVDVGARFQLSNIDFASDRDKTDTTVEGVDYLYGLSVFGSADAGEDMIIEGGLIYDPVLRYSAFALINFRRDFFQIKAGPFFGVLNDWNTILKPGISTAVRVDLPGLIFTRLEADSSIGGRLVRTGDYLQERSLIGVGFYVPNAICELSVLTKSFTEKSSTGEMVNELAAYTFSTDIYQKNRPYKVELRFAYQTRTLTFIEAVESEHVLNSLVIGTRLELQASKRLDLFFDLESNVYSFGEVDSTFIDFADSGIGIYLFSLSTGFSFSLED